MVRIIEDDANVTVISNCENLKMRVSELPTCELQTRCRPSCCGSSARMLVAPFTALVSTLRFPRL